MCSVKRYAALMLGLAVTSIGHAAIMWDESIHGDLTDDRFNPNHLSVSLGSNELIGHTGFHDRDYFRITLAPGQMLTSIILTGYVSIDDISFLAVQEGTFLTEDPLNANVANLLGWTFFGTPEIGVDLLPLMGSNYGSIGFTPPLSGTNYTFWLQQTGDPTDYALDFRVDAVPEPSTLAAAGVFLLGLARRRRLR